MSVDLDVAVRRPPFWLPIKAAILLLVGYWGVAATVAALQQFARHRYGFHGELFGDAQNLPQVISGTFAMVSLFYALVRAGGFHPSLRPAYAAWVAASPWRPGRPLPVGPPHLVWEDAVPAVVMAVLCPDLRLPMATIVAGFLALAGRVCYSGRDGKWLGYLAVNAVAGLLLAWPYPAASWALGVGLLVAADVAIRRSLADLPWVTPAADAARAERAKGAESHWPLAPVEPPTPVPWQHALGIAASAGWMAFCLVTLEQHVDAKSDGSTLFIAAAALVTAGLFRWGHYCGRHLPPITTWGRLRNGWVVIPGYDRGVVAPLFATALGIALPFAGDAAGLPVPVSVAVATFAVTAVVVGAGPTLRNWQLTGHHRIVVSRPRSRTAGKPAAV